jgi:lysophospholipase L1-like esterase
VLVLGDSMADAGFSQRMAAKVKARGGTLESDAWTSASTTTWARGDRLDKLLARVKPTHVFVVLGANEVFIPNPDVLAPNVRTIVGKVAAQPCVWVTPPLWKGETGIVAVEKAHAAPCRFFDSSTLAIARRKDGIHPTDAGGADWADAVWTALVADGP